MDSDISSMHFYPPRANDVLSNFTSNPRSSADSATRPRIKRSSRTKQQPDLPHSRDQHGAIIPRDARGFQGRSPLAPLILSKSGRTRNWSFPTYVDGYALHVIIVKVNGGSTQCDPTVDRIGKASPQISSPQLVLPWTKKSSPDHLVFSFKISNQDTLLREEVDPRRKVSEGTAS
ncbi:hypothetical protein KSP40_PGU016675 [Platanthera guangdongensis]|uniref:Uncharacterized protein n=1 Tax=Platanthera guangdongensis TaxID=2320717 RepID=A0ABR2MZT9_9ASPA